MRDMRRAVIVLRAAVVLRAVILLSPALLPGAAGAAVSPWSDHEVVRARLIAGTPAADGELRLGLHVQLVPGWHVYWKHGGDAGLPPEVALASEPALSTPRLLFPAPRRYALRGGLTAVGYDGEVVYPVRVRPVGAAPARLRASVDYLACEEECIPFRDELQLDLTAPAGDEEEALLAAWEARLPLGATAPEAAKLRVSGEFQGDRRGGAAILRLAGATSAAAPGPDLFVAPIAGVVVGVPSRQPGPGAPVFHVGLRPEGAALPARLGLEWTAVGLTEVAGSGAIDGVARVSTPAAGQAGVPAAATSGSDGGRGGLRILSLVGRGVLLALTPSCLALLALIVAAPASSARTSRRRRWSAPPLAAAALVAAVGLAALAGRLRGVALPLAEPLVVAMLALPHLALALALWWHGEALGRIGAGAAAVLAALLAVAWLPAVAPSAPVFTPGELGALAVGFAAPFAAAIALSGGLLRAADPGRSAGDTVVPRLSPPLVPLLGFLPAASLLWASRRLATALPPAQLAGVQLAWLTAALCAHLASGARGRGRLPAGAAAIAAAAASLLLAG